MGLATALMGEVVLIWKAEEEYFSTRLVVCKDSVPVAGVSMSVTDGVCCIGVEVSSSGHASLSGRQMLSLALL